MKPQTIPDKKIQNQIIPLVKAKVDRSLFNQKLKHWLNINYSSLYLTSQQSHHSINSTQSPSLNKSQLLKKIQSQFHIKYTLENLINRISLQFFQTIIKYIIQKKLFWIFKYTAQNKTTTQLTHKQIQVELSYQLKKLYKKFQYNQIHSHNQQNFKESSSNETNNIKKQNNNDFDFQLLVIFFIEVVSAFFKQYFPEIALNQQFKSEMYVIIIHVFLDLQVSTSAYHLLRKKYCYLEKEEQKKSLKSSGIHTLTITQPKKQDQRQRNDHNQISKKTINQSQTFVHISYKDSNLNNTFKNIRESNQKSLDFQSVPKVKSGKALNSTIGFSVNSIKRLNIKKDFSVKPMTSIDNNLITQRQNFLNQTSTNNNTYNCSRFQSFLQNTKKLNLPNNIQSLLANHSQFLSQEQQKFFSSIKDNLYVDSLPPIIKKKININQLAKMNEGQNVKEIRKEIKELDTVNKKNHMRTNDLSLAMNTFISQSCRSQLIPKRKRNRKDLEVIANYLHKQNSQVKNILNKQTHNQVIKQRRSLQNSRIDSNQFQFRSLPFKSALIKITPQKSSNNYAFTDKIENHNKNKEYSNHNVNQKPQYDSLRLTNKSRNTQKNLQRLKRMKQTNYQQKKKKSTTQWSQFIKNLKLNQQNNVIMSLRNQNLVQKKKAIQKKPSLLHFQQYDLNISLRSTNIVPKSAKKIAKGTERQIKMTQKQIKINMKEQQPTKLKSSKQKHPNKTPGKQSIKSIKQFTQRSQRSSQYSFQQNKQENKQNQKQSKDNLQAEQRRQSFFGQLSNGLQSYQIAKDQVDMQQISQNTNRNQVQNGKYSSLQGQVNINKDISSNYRSMYKSFDLKKKLKNFQDHCKKRQKKYNYSVFNVKNYQNALDKLESDQVELQVEEDEYDDY